MEKKYATPYEMEGKLPLKQVDSPWTSACACDVRGKLNPVDFDYRGAGCALNDSALLGYSSAECNADCGSRNIDSGFCNRSGRCKASNRYGNQFRIYRSVQQCGSWNWRRKLAYGAIMGASLLGGLFEGVLGFCLKPLRKFFPAIVTGTVVLSIGLSLISVVRIFWRRCEQWRLRIS